MTFVQKHFPLLKKILGKVVAVCKIDFHPVVDSNQNIVNMTVQSTVLREELREPESGDEEESTSDDSLTTVKADVLHEQSSSLPQVNVIQLDNLEATITAAIKKMETQQNTDYSKLVADINCVKASCETVKCLIANIKPSYAPENSICIAGEEPTARESTADRGWKRNHREIKF